MGDPGRQTAPSLDQELAYRRDAEEHAHQLQVLTQHLACMLSREEIGKIVIGQAHEYVGAAASVAYFSDDAGAMRLMAARGVPREIIDEHGALSLEAPIPLSVAIREGAPIWCANRQEILARFPHLASTRTPVDSLQAMAAIPLVFGSRTLGGFAFSFPKAMTFDASTKNLLVTFGLQCAQALERTRLYDEECRARARLEILAGMSRSLSEARLDLSAVLKTVCREVATRMPESCTINLLAQSGEILELAAVHHIDPEAEEGIRLTMSGRPVDARTGTLGRVATTGEPVLVPVVAMEALLTATQPEYRPYLQRYPMGSLLVVALRVADRIIGTMTAARSPALPSFTVDDQTLLQDLADRSAFAIENARLFEAEQQARRLRDDFLMIAGHELKTPLSALQLQVQGLRLQAEKGVFSEKPELLAPRLDKVVRHANRLGTLVAQLLDVSKLGSGRLTLTLEDVDLGGVVEDVVERFSQEASHAGSTLTVEICERAVGRWDRGRLDQVVTNLLGNAIKYGQGKPILVRLERERDVAHLTVRDEGIGIDLEAQRRIFGRFERAVSDRHFGGLGLGLWISRHIVQSLGGRIHFESTPGHGSTFYVELPCEAALET